MRSVHRGFIAVSVALISSAVGSAATIFNDGFEYADQAAMNANWVPYNTIGVTLDASRGAGGSAKSATVPGLASNTTNDYRSRRTFGDIGGPTVTNQITWSFDFYDTNATTSPSRNYANLQDTASPGSSAQLISMGFNNNLSNANDGGNYYMARILGYTPTFKPSTSGTNPATASGAYFKLNDGLAPLRSAGWHNLKFVSTAAAMQFYVDGVLAKTVNNTFNLANQNYDNIALGSGLSNASTEAGFDNMVLQTDTIVPEPTTLAALGAATLLLGRRRR